MATGTDDFLATLIASITASQRVETPYPHWFLTRCLPEEALDGHPDAGPGPDERRRVEGHGQHAAEDRVLG